MTVFTLTFSTLRKMFFSTWGFTFFSSAMRFFISRRFDTERLSGAQVVQVSVNLQAHCMKCRPL